MINEEVDSSRVLEELNGEEYGNHPEEVIETTLEEGVPQEYSDSGKLLNDLVTATEEVLAEDTREEAEEFVEEYTDALNLTEEASSFGIKILNYLDEESDRIYADHDAESIAGASTQIGSLFVNEKVTKTAAIHVADTSEHSFNGAYDEIYGKIEEGLQTDSFP